jgi:hypothetical protein
MATAGDDPGRAPKRPIALFSLLTDIDTEKQAKQFSFFNGFFKMLKSQRNHGCNTFREGINSLARRLLKRRLYKNFLVAIQPKGRGEPRKGVQAAPWNGHPEIFPKMPKK